MRLSVSISTIFSLFGVQTTFALLFRRRVARGVRWVRTYPPPPGAENVRLERAEDELTKTKNAKDEYFLLICQRTQLFTVKKTYPKLLITYNCVHDFTYNCDLISANHTVDERLVKEKPVISNAITNTLAIYYILYTKLPY